MSEVNERNLNNSMPEEAENKANAVEEAVETVQLEAADDKENAPRGEAAPALEEEKPAAKKKGKKKRRKKAFPKRTSSSAKTPCTGGLSKA